jgi:hypothetical protein
VKSLWEPAPPRGQCGKAAVRGIVIGVALGLALLAATLVGLV